MAYRIRDRKSAAQSRASFLLGKSGSRLFVFVSSFRHIFVMSAGGFDARPESRSAVIENEVYDEEYARRAEDYLKEYRQKPRAETATLEIEYGYDQQYDRA